MSSASSATISVDSQPRRGSLAKYSEKLRFSDYIRAYKKQIIWIFIFVIFQFFLFGMGVLRYMHQWLPNNPNQSFSVDTLFVFAFGMILQVDACVLAFYPAMRYIISKERKTFLAKLFPFDFGIAMHVIMGFTIFGVAIAHIITFAVLAVDRSVKFNMTVHRILGQSGIAGNDFLGYTAISGWVAFACLTVMTFLALPPLRKRNYDIFYWTHKLQFVFWAALIVHSMHIWKFLIIPLFLYFFEKIRKYSNVIRWNKVTKIVKVTLLPQDVTHLVIRRPKDFNYNPGDYCFLKIPSIGLFSWHPFTLSSCPENEDQLWFHIRASGNYTRALRNKFVKQYIVNASKTISPQQVVEIAQNGELPKAVADLQQTLTNLSVQVFLDGPYGASTTDLFRTEHAVLVGGGIGVTPMASVLGSVLAQFRRRRVQCPKCEHVHQSKDQTVAMNRQQLGLKKLDFIWVVKDQDQIQWFIDLLTCWEKEQSLMENEKLFLNCHIYITGKSDPSQNGTIRHPDGSVLGMQTEIHTGRPNWNDFMRNIRNNKEGPVRVFFCGPEPMQKDVRLVSAKYDFDFSWENF